MQNKVLKITFTQDIDQEIIWTIYYKNITTNFVDNDLYQWMKFSPRINNKQIQIYDPSSGDPSPYTSTPGEYTAQKFAYYLNLDKPNWISEVEQISNVVTISASPIAVDGFEYEFLGSLLLLGTPGGDANPIWPDASDYYNEISLSSTQFAISNISFVDYGVGPNCTFLKVVLETTTYLSRVEIISGGTQIYTRSLNPSLFPSNTSFETIGIQRGIAYKFKAISASAPTIDLEDVYPNIGFLSIPLLLASNFSFATFYSNSGLTFVIINNTEINTNDIPLELEYSINGSDWFLQSFVSGQEPGDYNIYIKDQFGCTVVIPFTLDYPERGPRLNPVHFISEANSIDYSLVEEINNCSTHPNYNNTRDRGSLNKMVYSQDILFNTCDQILTQFKTNFNSISVVLEKHGEGSQGVPILQRTNNFNIFESLDCNIYEYSPNLAGVYFTTGNVYNESNVIIDSHELNGSLPDFVKINQLITISNFGSFLIQDILFDENIDKNVFIIQNSFVSLPSEEVIKCTYDLLNYNVFEFGFNFNFLGEGMYRVKIKLNDDFFEGVDYISENIYVKEKHENTLCIDYYNQNNRDIFYKFGIKHRIRVHYLKIDYDIKEETLNNLGDNKSELVKSIINKKDNYVFDALTEKRRMTLILALSSEFCFINGVSYVKEGSFNINHIENTNLAEIEQEMIVSNVSYSLVENNAMVLRPQNLSPFIVSGVNFLTI